MGRVLVSVGDPNGIGPEIAVKAVAAMHASGATPPVVVADADVVAPLAARAGLRIRKATGATSASNGVLDLLPVTAILPGHHEPGRPTPHSGQATVAYLEAAVEEALRCNAPIVAGPHSETAVNAAGIAFAGYPRLLAELTGQDPDCTFLMLVGGGLRIVHATLHERLSDALSRLTPQLVANAGRAAAEALVSLGVAAPRVGMFGINPHAGEGGLFGDDDDHITVPAAAQLRRWECQVEGPVGADLLLARREEFDVFVAMYHDQGHVPVKLLAGRHAVALSIGTGVVFSSVGHGAAFDIAGTWRADPSALLNALRIVSGVA